MKGKILPFPIKAPVLAPVVEPETTPVLELRQQLGPLTPAPLARPRRALTPEEVGLRSKMLQAYFEGRHAARNHSRRFIRESKLLVMRFLDYVGQPPWECTPEDFESWAAHLALELDAAPGSQRVYQGAVAGFFDYLAESTMWQNEAYARFGARTVRIATTDNRLIHTTDTNKKRDRIYLSAEQLEVLFARIQDVLVECHARHPRMLKTLQRDYAMFATYYAYALRLMEGQSLTLDHFFENPDIRALGRFGFVNVKGKGAKGSGHRSRAVEAIHISTAQILNWYLSAVRPKFKAMPESQHLLWLSERGGALSRGAIASRYKSFIKHAGLNPKLFSLHGLRHMAISHEAAANIPLSFTQHRAGHVNGSTTQIYTHLPDGYSRTVAENLVLASMPSQER